MQVLTISQLQVLPSELFQPHQQVYPVLLSEPVTVTPQPYRIRLSLQQIFWRLPLTVSSLQLHVSSFLVELHLEVSY
jgi:hypothetical protein